MTQQTGSLVHVGPRVDFRIVADWGNANFHTIAGLLTAHLRWQSAPRSGFWIKTGTGYGDNLRALTSGEVDCAVTTPFDITAEWARAGKHFFDGEPPAPFIRTLGWFPQNDRLVFAIRKDCGITSFADLREKRYPLKLASGFRMRDNLMMWVVDRVLEEHGIEVEAWGGEWLQHDHPRICVPFLLNGEANAIINEGIVVPQWRELVEKIPMCFLPFERQALNALTTKYGLREAVLSKGCLRVPEDIPCLDWSNFAVLVRDDMSDDLAYRLTSIMVEQRCELEARYRHIPAELSPLTYPIEPHVMCRGGGAPLHAGAERYYRAHGYLA